MVRKAFLILAVLVMAAACGDKDNGDGPTPTVCADVEGTVESSGLEIRKPDQEVAACRVVPNPAGGSPGNVCEKKAAPDLSCVGKTSTVGGASVDVTMKGCVETFGLG